MVSDPGSLGMDLVKGKKLIRKEKIELDPVRIERKEIHMVHRTLNPNRVIERKRKKGIRIRFGLP